MTRGSRRTAWLRASLALLVVGPALALAQAPLSEATIPLATGFVPDPVEIEGHAHGARSFVDLAGSACAGFVGERPSHVMALDTRFGFLRIFATSDVDLVLGVRFVDVEGHPSWVCSDDRFGNVPGVEGVFPRGRTEIWVGTHTLGASADYVLHFTETRSIRPGVGAAGDDRTAATELGLDAAGEGRFDGIRLRRGFLPDPRWLEGEAGVSTSEAAPDAGVAESEPIEVTLLGNGCGGLVDPRPAHVVTLREDFDFLQLYLCGADDEAHCTVPTEPLSLVVLMPDGTFRCQVSRDAHVAVTAGLDEGGWPAGDYRVWVGVHAGSARLPYRLGVSELRRVR